MPSTSNAFHVLRLGASAVAKSTLNRQLLQLPTSEMSGISSLPRTVHLADTFATHGAQNAAPLAQVLSCSACAIAFTDSGAHREHARSEWHRYNLKRRVAAMPPVSHAAFLEKLAAFQQSPSSKPVYPILDTSCSYYVVGYF